jgi:hypothetical protein
MWSWAKPSGRPGGGGVHRARCRLCRAGLVACGDVYDDEGRVVPAPGRAEDLGLAWSLRGVPWQTLSLLLVAGTALWYLLRWAARP